MSTDSSYPHYPQLPVMTPAIFKRKMRMRFWIILIIDILLLIGLLIFVIYSFRDSLSSAEVNFKSNLLARVANAVVVQQGAEQSDEILQDFNAVAFDGVLTLNNARVPISFSFENISREDLLAAANAAANAFAKYNS